MKRPKCTSSTPAKTADAARGGHLPQTRNWWAAVALCSVTLAAYANSFGAGFTLDNRGIILRDPRIREASGQNLALILQKTYWWPYGESRLYRPFTTLSYLLNYAILGNADHAAGYHRINLLLHMGNVLLVFALMRRLFHDFWPSVLTAAVWAVHPVLTESVTNMVGRADLLAGMAVLGGLLAYLKGTESAGRSRWAWFTGLLLVTTIGVFSKESAVVIVPALLLYEGTWWVERRQYKGFIWGCIATGLPVGVLLLVRATVLSRLSAPHIAFTDNPLVGADFGVSRLTALGVLGRGLGLLAMPWHLSCDYSYAQILMASGTAQEWLSWALLAAAIAGVALLYRRQKPVFFLACLGFLSLLPTSNLIFPIGTIMAERFLYLPAIGFSAGFVILCFWLAKRTQMAAFAPLVPCLIVALFAVRTWARNDDWRDDQSLAKATVQAAPDSYKSHVLMAEALYDPESGHPDIDRVIAEAEKALAIVAHVEDSQAPPGLYKSAGEFYLAKADSIPPPSPERSQAYRRALELLRHARTIMDASIQVAFSRPQSGGRPTPKLDPAAIADLDRSAAEAASQLGDHAQAVDIASQAQQKDPLNPESYRRLSSALLAAGRNDDAAVELIKGNFLTADMSLRKELIELYRKGLDIQGCATTQGPYGPAINPGCPVVRRHVCAAAIEARRVYAQVHRPDLAEQLQSLAATDFGCKE